MVCHQIAVATILVEMVLIVEVLALIMLNSSISATRSCLFMTEFSHVKRHVRFVDWLPESTPTFCHNPQDGGGTPRCFCRPVWTSFQSRSLAGVWLWDCQKHAILLPWDNFESRFLLSTTLIQVFCYYQASEKSEHHYKWSIPIGKKCTKTPCFHGTKKLSQEWKGNLVRLWSVIR